MTALMEATHPPTPWPAPRTVTSGPTWPDVYIAAMAAGKEWPAGTGLGRVRARVRSRTVEGRWRIPPSQRFRRMVDGVGFAETADGPLLLACRLPVGMARAVPPGGVLIMVLPMPVPGMPYTISVCVAEVHP